MLNALMLMTMHEALDQEAQNIDTEMLIEMRARYSKTEKSKKRIQYTDEDIDRLLDRSQQGDHDVLCQLACVDITHARLADQNRRIVERVQSGGHLGRCESRDTGRRR